MRWVNVGFSIAVVALLAFNLRSQFATQRKLDALAALAAPVTGPPPADSAKVAPGAEENGYVIEAPDVLRVEVAGTAMPGAAGEHLVRPDGTVSLGAYGAVYVSGLPLDGARQKVESHLSKFDPKAVVKLSVFGFNSKAYYVISSQADEEHVTRVPCRGNETVLDAVAAVGVTRTDRKVHIARRGASEGQPFRVLPVDLAAIKNGDTATNYQIVPGDRVYLAAR